MLNTHKITRGVGAFQFPTYVGGNYTLESVVICQIWDLNVIWLEHGVLEIEVLMMKFS